MTSKYLKFNNRAEADQANHAAWLKKTGRTEEESRKYTTQFLCSTLPAATTGECELKVPEHRISCFKEAEIAKMTEHPSLVVDQISVKAPLNPEINP